MRKLAAAALALALFVAPDVVRGDGALYRCFDASGVLVALGQPVSGRGIRCEVVPGTETSRTPRAPARPAMQVTTTTAFPAAFGRTPFAAPLATGDRFTRYDAHIAEAAQLFQLPPHFIRAVVKVESNFHPEVVSRTGAVGLMQLMPGTARSMGVANPFDPRQNILGGSRYLRILANLFHGDLVMTVAAYNAGEGAVLRYRGVPPYDETRRYVQRVLHHYYAFRSGTGTVRDPR